ncbi:hypothetical protein EBR96_00840 [bacterium]|nr:hypothetical protein [bacterium]
MKVYTCFTPSHKVFYDNYFLPSLPTDDDIELVSEEFPQECSGEFMSSGWNDTMERKVNSFIRATKVIWIGGI